MQLQLKSQHIFLIAPLPSLITPLIADQLWYNINNWQVKPKIKQ